jgi:hypothetical protein
VKKIPGRSGNHTCEDPGWIGGKWVRHWDAIILYCVGDLFVALSIFLDYDPSGFEPPTEYNNEQI